MAGKDPVSTQDLASSLQNLGESTTAAELVRKQGQSKKLKVISEKKLMEWILSLLNQHLAGKADAFSDAEKEELLRKTQKELEKRILREQAAESERSRIQNELQNAMQVLGNAKSSQADYEKAMEALKAKLENAEQTNQDIQQDNYELQDQLQEKMALLSTTLSEKDKLRETVRAQMIHSGDLIGGVLGIDNQYYGGRHQEENPVSESAGQDEQFYHDFGTGSKVIQTLMNDLERLRGIAKQSLEDKAERENDPRANLLEGDLLLLEQLKEGSLSAMDVAQPVANLIEALDGARTEAEEMENTVSKVTGASSQKVPFTALPDPSGDPAEVLAGATTVARELAAELARSRQRIVALKQIADEAEQERVDSENGIQQLRYAYNQVLGALEDRAKTDHVDLPPALADEEATPEKRSEAAIGLIEKLQGGSPEATQAISDQIQVVNRLIGADEDAAPVNVKKVDQKKLSDRLRSAGSALEKLVNEQRRELDAGTKREQSLAEQVRALARLRKNAPDAPAHPKLDKTLASLDQALTDHDEKSAVSGAAEKVITALQEQVEADQSAANAVAKELARARTLETELAEARDELKRAQEQTRSQAQVDRAIASQLLRAAKGDDSLAESTADLALAMEQGADADDAAKELQKQLQATVAALSARKQELAKDNDRLSSDIAKVRGELAKTEEKRASDAANDRAIAATLVEAARGDADLSDATADLALALEDAKPGDPVPTDVFKRTVTALADRKKQIAEEADRLKTELDEVRTQLKDASERASTLEVERDEMAESGKEIITQLRQQKDSREAELNELRVENNAAAAKLGEFQDRMTQAESANRKLAEALSALANATLKDGIEDAPSIEDPRMDLELALSQLPGEGEEDVVAPADISSQIAESGQKLAQAMIARNQAGTKAISKAQKNQQNLMGEIEKLRGEIATTKSAIDERDNSLKRNQAEVSAIRKEMTEQGNALAARVQDLSNARSELLSAKADLEVAQSRLSDQESRLNEARSQLAEARKDLEEMRSEHAEAHARAESAVQNQLLIAQSLRSLGGPASGNLSDPISKAAQKLEMAKSVGGDELANAGKSFVEAVRSQTQSLAGELSDTRSQLETTKSNEARLQSELANLRGAVVDRDHSIENLNVELVKANEVQANAVSELLDKGSELDALNERLTLLQESLNQAEAELEDYRARGGASAENINEELVSLRKDLSKEQLARKQLDAELHGLREKVESSEAKLKRQREEFQRMLEERDQVIQDKDRLLDEHGSKNVDVKGLEAQVNMLSQQLSSANERIKEMEAQYGEHVGSSVKTSDLAKEIKKAHNERDSLREQKRMLENDLADAVSSTDELRTQLDEKRKEIQEAREEMAKEVAEERQKTAAMKEEFRKLKEEVVGLRARLRRLTDGK
ncbi:MAG: hypothetical protein H0V44_12555 [Planctomycetes bacterium]|nr:hypothetical protein [Planctomycetota bacterium]